VAKHEKACKPNWKPKKNEFNQKKDIKQKDKGDLKGYGWRDKHKDFMESMQYMKKMKNFEQNGGNVKDLPPPPASKNNDYVQCDYCGRKFAP